jgi:hypothetical protein
MRLWFIIIFIATFTGLCFSQKTEPQAQQPKMPTEFGNSAQPKAVYPSTGDKLSDMFESKIRAEWEAIRNKDKKAYADLLADDFEGVEVDNKGERTKPQVVNELAESNLFQYTLWGFKLIPAGPDGALAIYEVNMQFPPKSAVRFSRVYVSALWLKRAGEWKEVHYQETHVK